MKTSLKLSALLLGLAFAPSVLAQNSQRFTVLHVNDTHGRFWENERGEYGFAAQKTLIDQIKKEVHKQGGSVLILHAGDVNTGVPESDLQQARPDIEAMNAIGYDAMAIGNHEFDNPNSLLQQQQKWAKFPFLSANVVQKSNQQPLAQPYAILNKKGLKIAIIGLTTPDTAHIVNPTHTQDWLFQDPIQAAHNIINKLNAEKKADVIIGLTHLGYYHNAKHGNNAAGDVTLARKLPHGSLAMIVGGHTHTTVCMNPDGSLNEKFQAGDACKPDYQNGIWIAQAGEWGKFLGRADFEYKNGKATLLNYQLIPINLKQKVKNTEGKSEYRPIAAEIPADKRLYAKLKKYQDKGEKSVMIEVGMSEGEFLGGKDHARYQPSSLGRLLAQTQKDAVRGADLAIINGGGIRASLPSGTVRYKDILTVQPFGNTLTYVDFTGAELLNYLKQVAMKESGEGAYPQFSPNVSMKIQRSKKRISDVRINQKPIVATQTYRLVVNDFLAAGGDSYPKITQHKTFVNTGLVDAKAVETHFAKHSPVKESDFVPKGEIQEIK